MTLFQRFRVGALQIRSRSIPPRLRLPWAHRIAVQIGRCHVFNLTPIVATIAVGVGLAVSSPLSAQESAIEEIIVTASKRGEQSVQDVPISISVVNESKIEAAGMDNFLDYIRTVPSVGYRIQSPAGGRGDLRGGRRVAIRGIESGDDGIPTTAFYLDEAPVPVMDPKLFDINRIEVLRGPQGTLYGANSMGGTIRVVMNKPMLNEYDYKVDATFASISHSGDETYRTNGMVNVPLVEDKVALRGVMFYRNEGGYINNVLQPATVTPDVAVDKGINTEESWGVRLAAVFSPTPNLTITPSVFRHELQIDDTPKFEENFRDLAYSNKLVAEAQENNFTLYGLEANYLFGDWELFSSTTFFESEFLSVDNFSKQYYRWGLPPDDPTIGGTGLQDIRSERLSQELRLTYTGSDRWNGVFGIFYMDETRDFAQELPNDTLTVSFPQETSLFTGTQDNSDERIAVFGEATVFLSDSINLTAGLRWFDSDQERLTIFDGLLNGGLAIVEGSSSDGAVSPKVQLTYMMSDDDMVYASASKGFRPGGPTDLVPPSCDADLLELGLTEPLTEFESDELWSYEVGTKSTFASNRLVVNASAYLIDWTDVQQAVRLACGFGFVGNVGEAESRGVEVEVRAAPTDNWDLFASFGFTDAEFTKTSEEVGVVAGDRIRNVPELTASASAQYNFTAMNGHDAYVRGDFQFVDEMVADGSAGPGVQFRPSYSLVNLGFGVMLTERLQLVLFGSNLTDERPVLAISDGSSPPGISREFATSRPRTFGFTFRYAHQ